MRFLPPHLEVAEWNNGADLVLHLPVFCGLGG